MLNKLIKSALIVDPNKYQAQLLSQSLQGAGVASVKHQANSTEALESLSLLSPEAVFVDSDLEPMDGRTFVRELRRSAHVRNRKTAVFLMAQGANPLTLAQAMDLGANAMLAKPIAPPQAIAAIKKVLEAPRPFVDGPTYFGPCRRLGTASAPNPCPRRRAEDKAMERLERMAERDDLVLQLTRQGPLAASGDVQALARCRKAAARLTDIALLLNDDVIHWAATAIMRVLDQDTDPTLREKSGVLFKALGLFVDGDIGDEKRGQVLDYIRGVMGARAA